MNDKGNVHQIYSIRIVPVLFPGIIYLSLMMILVTQDAFQQFIVKPRNLFFWVCELIYEMFWYFSGYYFPLSNLITSRDEEGAIKRLNSYPEEIRRPIGNNEIPLHTACRHRLSDDFICELIDRDPGGVMKQNAYDETPLHHLCYQSINLRLVEKFIQASNGDVLSIRNMQGHTPLAIQCLYPYSDANVIRTLILADHSEVESDSNIASLLGKILLHDKSDILSYAHTSNGLKWTEIINSTELLKNCWAKIRLLLRVSAIHYDALEDDDTDINYVHAVVKLKLIFSRFLLKLVLELHPDDCFETKNGQTTLSMAIDNSHIPISGIKDILSCCPHQISMIDLKTGLLPFMQAGVGKHARLDLIFHLLLQYPNLLIS